MPAAQTPAVVVSPVPSVASGVRLQVEPPGGLGIGPTVHRQGDEIGSVVVVADHRDAWPARLATNGVEPDRAEGVRLRSPEAAAAPGEPIDGAVHHVGCTGKHAWRSFGLRGCAAVIATGRRLP